MVTISFRPLVLAGLLLVVAGLSACATKPAMRRSMSAHECMTRVMYFESNRSSPEGMIAVGTVVMNRLNSGKYPNTVCGVVGQKNQFAPGVLTRDMEAGRDLAAKMATKVLRGGRHPDVERAMFFHTAGMTFPYTNMHYLIEAGGNVFYEKRKNARRISDPPFRNGMRANEGGYAALAPQPMTRPADPARPVMAARAAESPRLDAPLALEASPVAPRRAAPSSRAPIPAASPEPVRIEDLILSTRY